MLPHFIGIGGSELCVAGARRERRGVWEHVRPWLFPAACAGCEAAGAGLCAACAASASPQRLDLDGRPVDAAGSYDGPLRAAILAVKRGERAALDPLARLVAPLVPAGSVLVPVPTLRRRAAALGFDQARVLALRIARLRGATVCDLLTKDGAAQRGRAREARLATDQRFRVRSGIAPLAAVRLVDDVMTTGATLRAAASALEGAGIVVAGAVVVAYAAARETAGRGEQSQ